MYRVIIVDDEMIIRAGFKSFIDWNAEGFEMVGEASNGIEALELCRKVKPHLVFTDIVMNKLDGIGFIEQLLKEQPDVRVIILSCIEEFGTLQKALRLGVRDYFLKLSFSPGQLIPLLRTLKDELDAAGGEGSKKGDSSELAAYLALQQAYRHYLEKGVNPTALPPHSRLTPEALKGDGMALFLIRRDGASAGENANEGFTPTVSILREMFSRSYPADIVELSPGTVLMLLQNFLPMERQEVHSHMREIQKNLMRMMHLSVSVGVCLTLGNLTRFCEAYQALEMLEDKRFYEGDGVLLIDDGLGEGYKRTSKALNWTETADHISDALEAYDFDKAFGELENVLSRASALKNLRRQSMVDGVMLLMMQYDRVYRRTLPPDQLPEMELSQFAGQSWTMDKLFSQAIAFAQSVRCALESRSREAGVRIEIEKAKAFVKNNLSSSINTRTVSEMLGFNYSYFSVLFKKETGMNFSDYLSKERMRAAMRMLVETRKSVEEIANELGYSDVSHFRKLFRNEFGWGPSEVRSINKNKDTRSGGTNLG